MDSRHFSILHADEDLLAVSKPAGWLVHRTRLAPGAKGMVEVLERQLGAPLFPVHRIDRATSGVLLFARDRDTASRLAALFRARRGLAKTYLAIVRGWLPDSGEIDKPLRRLVGVDGKPAPEEAPALPALSCYRTLQRIELPVKIGPHPTTRYSLLEVTPVTGRNHQIRRHFCSVRHPLVGDTVYGEGRHNRYFREALGFHRLALHAWKLQIEDRPSAGRVDSIFTAPLPPEWLELFARWDWEFSG